jgi:hypothetical protein
MGACPILVEFDVCANDRGKLVQGTISMDDAKVVERMLVFGVQRLAEGMENSLKRLVVPRSEKFPGYNVGVHDISSWVH